MKPKSLELISPNMSKSKTNGIPHSEDLIKASVLTFAPIFGWWNHVVPPLLDFVFALLVDCFFWPRSSRLSHFNILCFMAILWECLQKFLFDQKKNVKNKLRIYFLRVLSFLVITYVIWRERKSKILIRSHIGSTRNSGLVLTLGSNLHLELYFVELWSWLECLSLRVGP